MVYLKRPHDGRLRRGYLTSDFQVLSALCQAAIHTHHIMIRSNVRIHIGYLDLKITFEKEYNDQLSKTNQLTTYVNTPKLHNKGKRCGHWQGLEGPHRVERKTGICVAVLCSNVLGVLEHGARACACVLACDSSLPCPRL